MRQIVSPTAGARSEEMMGGGMRSRATGVAVLRGAMVVAVLAAMWMMPAAEAQGVSTLELEALNRNKTVLHEKLLSSYKRFVPPVGGAQVAIQLALYSIVEVSTAKQTIQIQGWWRHYWADSRLTWNAEEWGVDSLIFSFEEIWRPDDMVYELIEEVDSGVPALTVYPGGSLFYSAPRVSTIRCKMDLDAYPYDTQRCDFTVGSVSYDASLVDVVPRAVDGETWFIEREGQPPQMKTGIDLGQYKTNTEFALRRVRITAKNNYYSCCVYPYPVIIYELIIERQTTTFITGIMVPIIVVTLVGFAVLLTPSPLSGARPGISVSVMFTTSAIYLVAARKMPDLGRLTLVGRLYIVSLMSSLLMIFISILTTAINLVVSEENSNRADLLTMFRHYDSDKSGHLDTDEAAKALNALGITKDDRDDLLGAVNISAAGISLDDWLSLGEAARALRPSTQDNIIIAWILRKLKKRGQVRQSNRLARVQAERTTSGVLAAPAVQAPSSGANGTNGTSERVNVAGGSMGASAIQQGRRGSAMSVPGDILSDFDASMKRIKGWLEKMGYGEDVCERFNDECIDVQALSLIPMDKLAVLGITKVGHQAKLIAQAKVTVERGQRRTSLLITEPMAEPLAMSQHDVESKRNDGFHVISVVEPGGGMTTKAKLARHGSIYTMAAKTTKGKDTWLKHLGAHIDFYSIIIFPAAFIMYLILEFSGVIIGRPIDWAPKASDIVDTIIELVDERAGETGERICFANYQDLGSGVAAEEICALPTWG